MPQLLMLKQLRLNGSMMTYKKKGGARFIIRNWNTKGGNEQIPGVTGKFGHEVQKEAKQRLTVLSREHTVHSKHPLHNTRDDSTYEHHQMVNTEIRLIIFFAAKDG